MPDWNPEPDDPAFEAGYQFVTAAKQRADGFHGAAPWFYGWAVRQAFWEGIKWERNQRMKENDDENRNG
jgi:hypothetical protein